MQLYLQVRLHARAYNTRDRNRVVAGATLVHVYLLGIVDVFRLCTRTRCLELNHFY